MDKEYIATGKLRYAALDLPLPSIHPLAFKAALAADCAGAQGPFWGMHHRLFDYQKALEPFTGHAEALGLDLEAFEKCLENPEMTAAVRRDMAEASKAGFTGTPSFVLGLTDPDDPTKVEGLTFIRGAQAFAAFKAEIDSALADLGSTD